MDTPSRDAIVTVLHNRSLPKWRSELSSGRDLDDVLVSTTTEFGDEVARVMNAVSMDPVLTAEAAVIDLQGDYTDDDRLEFERLLIASRVLSSKGTP